MSITENAQNQLIKDGDLLADGYENSIIGILTSIGKDGKEYRRVVYSVDKILNQLVEGGMGADDVEEFFEYNIDGAYVGPQTPVFITERWSV